MSRPTVRGSTGTGGAASTGGEFDRRCGVGVNGRGRRCDHGLRLAERSLRLHGRGLGLADVGLGPCDNGLRLHGGCLGLRVGHQLDGSRRLGFESRLDRVGHRLGQIPLPRRQSSTLTVVLELERDDLVEAAQPGDDPLQVVLALARYADGIALDLRLDLRELVPDELGDLLRDVLGQTTPELDLLADLFPPAGSTLPQSKILSDRLRRIAFDSIRSLTTPAWNSSSVVTTSSPLPCSMSMWALLRS